MLACYQYMNSISYPYLPDGKKIYYVPADNQFIIIARDHALTYSLDKVMPNSSVIVKDGKVIAKGTNGSDYHEKFPCERVIRNIPTGQGYDLCEGCHPKNHGEQRAIHDSEVQGVDVRGSDLYLWGHWWCCEPCWNVMINAGIENVFLVEGSERMFDKNHPENIIGRQFDILSEI